MVVGWYHSHPGFGCWLSGVDINTQQSFEALNQRAVSIVIDPIQSVKGKVGRQSLAMKSSSKQFTIQDAGHRAVSIVIDPMQSVMCKVGRRNVTNKKPTE